MLAIYPCMPVPVCMSLPFVHSPSLVPAEVPRGRAQGVTQALIQEEDAALSGEDIMAAINGLLREHRLELLTNHSGGMVFRAVAEEQASK